MRLIQVFLILCSMNTFAQATKTISFGSFKKEYKELIAKQPDQNYSVGINFFYFNSKEEKETMQSQISELKVLEGNRYIYQSGSNIQIQEGDIRLDIDTILKRILVSKAKLQRFDITSDSMFMNLDSSKYLITKSTNKSQLTYVISEQEQLSNYQEITFIFELKTNRFMGLELLLWPANYSAEHLEDESKEQPFIVYSYSVFKKIKATELKPDDRASSWFTSDNSGALVSKKLDYQLHDLR